jgi:Protein of unknown function (DUF559)
MARVARRQHGVVSRWQLVGLRMSRQAIDTRLRRGNLHELHFGVYAVGTRRIGRRGRWMAAVLASSDGTVLSHRSAGQLWRIVPLAAERVEVTSPPPSRARREGIVGHRALIRHDERQVVDGIPVTSPFRTVLDLSAVLKRRELKRALHELQVRQLTDRVSFDELLARYPGRRGSAVLRELLGSKEPTGVTRNDFEEGFLALVDAHGLPRPRMNADLALRGRFYEIDALWARQRVAVELDSRSVHATPRNFESDRRRDRILLAEGYRTVRVTWRQLKDEPAAVIADLRLALEPPGPDRMTRKRFTL